MLADGLSHNRVAILKRWFERIIATYPSGAAAFLGRQSDPFQNPVGQTIFREIEVLYDHLLSGADAERVTRSLDNIIRIRAVQDFTPSQAVGFLFELRHILRDELQPELGAPGSAPAWAELESRIDQLALLAFDVYMECRERIFDIRAKEIKRAVSPGLRVPPESPEPETGAERPCGPTGGNT